MQRRETTRGMGGLLAAVAVLALVTVAQAGWSEPQNVWHTYHYFSYNETMDIDSDGKIHIAWQDWDDGAVTIMYATNRSGIWEKTNIFSNYYQAGNPQLVITPDQVIHLFANSGREYGSSTDNRVWEFTKPVSGGSWSGPSVASPTDGPLLCDAAVDSSGGILITYFYVRFDPNHGENYARYKPLGGSWGGTELIKNAPSNGWPSGSYITASGMKFYVGYNNTEDKPWYRVRDNGVWGPESQVASDGAAPRFAVHPTNPNFLAAVYFIGSYAGNPWTCLVTLSSDGGANWTTPYRFSTLPANEPHIDNRALATFTSDGNLHVFWEHYGDGVSNKGGYYRVRYSNGSWGGTTFIENTIGIGDALVTEARPLGNTVHLAMAASNFEDDFHDPAYVTIANPVPPDTTPPWAVSGFDADPGNGYAYLEWDCPADYQYGGTRIIYKTTGYPTSPTDGTVVANVSGGAAQTRSYTHYTTNGVKHYYAAFSYDTSGNFGAADTSSTTPFMRSDFDKDGDVDLADFGHIQECMTGGGVEQTDPDCLDARLDFDGSYYGDKDVDSADMDILLNCLSGADVYAPPSCDP